MPGCCNPSPNPAGMPLVGENPSSLPAQPAPSPALCSLPRHSRKRSSDIQIPGTALGEGRSCAEREGNSWHSYGWEGGIQVKHHPEVDSETLASDQLA